MYIYVYILYIYKYKYIVYIIYNIFNNVDQNFKEVNIANIKKSLTLVVKVESLKFIRQNICH